PTPVAMRSQPRPMSTTVRELTVPACGIATQSRTVVTWKPPNARDQPRGTRESYLGYADHQATTQLHAAQRDLEICRPRRPQVRLAKLSLRVRRCASDYAHAARATRRQGARRWARPSRGRSLSRRDTRSHSVRDAPASRWRSDPPIR